MCRPEIISRGDPLVHTGGIEDHLVALSAITMHPLLVWEPRKFIEVKKIRSGYRSHFCSQSGFTRATVTQHGNPLRDVGQWFGGGLHDAELLAVVGRIATHVGAVSTNTTLN